MTWGEDHADGRARVYMRRVTGVGPSAFPQELSIPDLGGQAGGPADSADIDIEDDGSFAWAVFRQDFGGGSRSVARRLLGSTFDPAVPLDGGPSTIRPRIAINGRGQGLATLQGGGGVLGAFNYNDVFEPTQPLHFAGAPNSEPQPASSEHREVIAAWLVDGCAQGPAQAGADEAVRERGHALAARARAGRRRASSPPPPTASRASPWR